MNIPTKDLMFLIKVAEDGLDNEEEKDRYEKLRDKIRGIE